MYVYMYVCNNKQTNNNNNNNNNNNKLISQRTIHVNLVEPAPETY